MKNIDTLNEVRWDLFIVFRLRTLHAYLWQLLSILMWTMGEGGYVQTHLFPPSICLIQDHVISLFEYMVNSGHKWRATTRILCCPKCQEIYSPLFILEEEPVKENNGFLLILQLCQVPFRTSSLYQDWVPWYSWEAKAAKTNVYLFWFLRSKEGHPVMHRCRCTWSGYSCCGMLLLFLSTQSVVYSWLEPVYEFGGGGWTYSLFLLFFLGFKVANL